LSIIEMLSRIVVSLVILSASVYGVKQCLMYSNNLVEEVQNCITDSSHSFASHGCYYAFNFANSTTLALETQGMCGTGVCTSGKEDCTVTSSTQRDGGKTTSMLCCCYTEKCNPKKRAEALRDEMNTKN
ncbi:hypothetical protein PENTCL1PPCAC_11657, partial [Pristionchus entomophagus]